MNLSKSLIKFRTCIMSTEKFNEFYSIILDLIMFAVAQDKYFINIIVVYTVSVDQIHRNFSF